jgi:cytoskeletal protein CcmA (bactofilin family)
MGSSIIIGNNNIVSGQNIVIQDGMVMVDGKRVNLPENEKIINIQTENLESIRVDSCNEISVKGNVGDIHVSQGRVSIEGHVKGDVRVSQGDVNCYGSVEGDISVSMGSITTQILR